MKSEGTYLEMMKQDGSLGSSHVNYLSHVVGAESH